MQMLNDKVAFITGGASGIGAGTARRFAAEGARIVIADVQEEDGHQLVAELESKGAQALYIECDVSEPHSVKAAIDAAVARFGASTSCSPTRASTACGRRLRNSNPKNGTKPSTSI